MNTDKNTRIFRPRYFEVDIHIHRLKTVLNDWRAQKLWSLLEKRAEQKEYCHQKACERLSVLVIGAG